MICCAISLVSWMVLLLPTFLGGDERVETAIFLSRSDHIPPKDVEEVSDLYFEGYIQALIDMHYHEFRVHVVVKEHKAYLFNLPKNELTKSSIISFVCDIPGVISVEEVYPGEYAEENIEQEQARWLRRGGVWFPQTTQLFLPLVANPRQVVNAIGYRQGDSVIGQHVIPISLGDDFALYRWLDVFWGGDLQISIESGIWSVFDLDPHPNPNGGPALVNTDFYVAIPLTAAVNEWAFRFRIYHLSSHLGDEYMVNHPEVMRLNPTFEAIDFFVSYQALSSLRLYIGSGALFDTDTSFPMKPFYLEYGGEYRFWGRKFYHQGLFGAFFLAAHFRTYQYLNYDFDGTCKLGYEFSQLKGIGRKLRAFATYHNGFSVEGQFMKERTSYFEYQFSYGF
ncbi:MAG: DUF1207 domain-containing protein [Chlamydiota bacterium]